MSNWHRVFESNSVFFTADLHLNHKNICRGTSQWDLSRQESSSHSSTRDFNTVEEMNGAIIKSINDAVDENKTLFILGDILFGQHKLVQLPLLLDRIKCRNIIYIFGNHCDKLRPLWHDYFKDAYDYLEIFVKDENKHINKMLCLFHYPLKVWNNSHKGSYALTGHSHGSLPYAAHELGLDIGWDVHKRPLSFHEVHAIMQNKVWKPVDHHVVGTN